MELRGEHALTNNTSRRGPGHTGRQRIHLCEDKTHASDNRGVVMCMIELAAAKAPDWVMLFPAADAQQEIKCRDGRVYRMTNPDQIVAAFNAENHPIPFDKNHDVEKSLGWGGGSGEAVGWIEELRLTSAGAIEARVEWTSEGRELVESKAYRYVSPAFTITTELVNSIEKYRITMPTSAGLVNRPAMTMPAITSHQGKAKMDKLLALLGLKEGATQEEIDAATKKFEAKVAADEAAQKEAEQTAAKLKAELAAEKAKSTDINQVVPRAAFDEVKAEVASLREKQEADKKAAHQAAVDAAIAKALTDGKITPATKDFYTKTCASAEGLKSFVDFCAAAPAIAPDSGAQGGQPPPAQSGAATLTSEERDVMKRLGISEEKFLAAKKEQAA